MRRRHLLIGLFGSIVPGRLAQAQTAARRPVIGFLGANTAASQSQWTAAFLERLRERGWSDGRNVAIEYRWAEGRTGSFTEIATEFARSKVDVIVTSGTAPALAAKAATSTIPVVFAASSDPLETGLVASLARPGGNVTGLSTQVADLATKRLELLMEVVRSLKRVAILYNGSAPASVIEAGVISATAAKLGIEASMMEIRRDLEIASAIAASSAKSDALIVVTDPLMFVHRLRLNALAIGARLPTLHSFREHIEAGGLISYGPSYVDMFRRAADIVDKILRGAKPADIPVEQPTRFSFVINQKTAAALGIEVSPMLLARADEVIE